MDTLSLTKEARIYNGVKTISLTSGAGKTGQPLALPICKQYFLNGLKVLVTVFWKLNYLTKSFKVCSCG